MQDVVGCRIVVDGGRAEQDAVVAAVVQRFSDSRTVDWQEDPSGGYRAVHVVVRHRGWPVEIQVRTALQDAWAQTFERFADVFGRELRYGGAPSVEWAGSQFRWRRLLIPIMRREAEALSRALQRLADVIDAVERTEAPPEAFEKVRHALIRQQRRIVALIDRIDGRRR